MPELPEVETICQGLKPIVEKSRFCNVVVRRSDLRIPVPDNLSEALAGREIQAIRRRAKYMLMELDNHMVLIIHLGMSGKMLVRPSPYMDYARHDHVVMALDNGQNIIFNDPRRFGLVILVAHDVLFTHRLFLHLGPEPLEDEFSAHYLHTVLMSRKAPIKQILMNNRIVVGVGNIYACESLFRSGIHPKRPAHTLSIEDCERCVLDIKEVLKEAIMAGGSTIKDFVSSSGDGGYFQHHFSVYNREGESCLSCQNTVERIKQAGRSTFLCGTCQT